MRAYSNQGPMYNILIFIKTHKCLTIFLQKIVNWFQTSSNDSTHGPCSTKAGKCILVIVMMILLHNSDGIDLTDKAYAEETQQKYVNLLNKYLKAHLKSSLIYEQLHEGMMLIHYTKRMHELSSQRLKFGF